MAKSDTGNTSLPINQMAQGFEQASLFPYREWSVLLVMRQKELEAHLVTNKPAEGTTQVGVAQGQVMPALVGS